MPGADREVGVDFERLEVWRRSKDLSVELYRGLSSCLDYGFRYQLTRSRLSVPSNIAEGMERPSDAEKAYVSMLRRALAPSGEHNDRLARNSAISMPPLQIAGVQKPGSFP